MITTVVKSDGRTETFEPIKFANAVLSASSSVHRFVSSQLWADISELLTSIRPDDNIRHVDEIHDAVELALIQSGEVEVAREYMRYRVQKRQNFGRAIPANVREAFELSARYFPEPYQQFQFYNKYARFDHELGRRETWPEAVKRVSSFLRELAPNFPAFQLANIEAGMLNLRVMPSMRLLAMAGPASRRNHICLYNCAYEVIDDPYAFVEALLILGNGTGFGYSVESKFVDKLPAIGDAFLSDPSCYSKIRVWDRGDELEPTIVVHDSLEGWATALYEGLKNWWAGMDVSFDYSQLRPAGAPLRTKGGTASGPEPLRRMLAYVRRVLLEAHGRKLTTLEVHDILCVIADCIVSGGVRRSAMIALFDWDDEQMESCKSGNWYSDSPWRSNANNSAVIPLSDPYLSEQDVSDYVDEMHDSRAGEPGLFSRYVARAIMPSRRGEKLSNEAASKLGTNPCGEIVLLDGQFCNLSIAVARAGMSEAELLEAVRLAALIGTIQSSATHFPGLRSKWQANCEAERLLGVDITGQMDYAPDGLPADLLRRARELVIQTNEAYCGFAGVTPSAATTCAKPGGNSSWLLGCASGIHKRPFKYQIRRFTLSEHEPMFEVLKRSGVPMERYGDKWLAVFPVAAPEHAITESTALEQLNYWLRVKMNFTEHNPSCTINYRARELEAIKTWLFANQNYVGGLTFLPISDHIYTAAPNEEITESEYRKRVAEFPAIDFSQLYAVELTDKTSSSREFACVGGACDLDMS